MCMMKADHTHRVAKMRTNVEIDDALMAEAKEALGLKTKKAVIEEALRQLIQVKRQKGILDLFGAVTWEGDLDEMRKDRDTDRNDRRGGAA